MAGWDAARAALNNMVRGQCNHAGCDKPARSGAAFYCEEHKDLHGKSGGTPSPVVASPVGPATDSGEAGGVYTDTETRPGGNSATATPPPPKPSLVDKALGRTPKATGEIRPAKSKSGSRVKTAEFWGDVTSGLSGLVARTGDLPVARAMSWTSPVAGDIIEDATKDTFADKLVQPLARNAGKWEDLFDLLGFWGAIGAAERNPAQAGMALQFARKRFVRLLPRIHKKIMAERKLEREAAEAVVDLMPDIADLFDGGVIPPGVDPIDALLQSMFAMPMATEPEGATT